jgi:hypothetical protein
MLLTLTREGIEGKASQKDTNTISKEAFLEPVWSFS